MVLQSRAYRAAAVLLALGALTGLSTAARGQVTVFSGSDSQASNCSQHAVRGEANENTIHTCTIALEHEPLVGRDLAGTYVNRGVLYLALGAWDRARTDFTTALSLDPKMGEALINLGAINIAQRHWAEGVAEIDRGLSFNPQQPEKAYYNRALAKEKLDDVKGAYLDYMKAAELAPTWELPQVELKRFSVSHSAGA